MCGPRFHFLKLYLIDQEWFNKYIIKKEKNPQKETGKLDIVKSLVINRKGNQE